MLKSNIEFTRLKNVLLSDKIASPERLNEVITMDILKALSNYMEIHSNCLEVFLDTTEEGYNITIKGVAKRLKTFGTLPY